MDNKETFRYTYSAKQQAEIETIRKKYAPAEEDALTQLRRLDAGVTQKATVVSLVVGILGLLLMGGGMSLIMTELGAELGLSSLAEMLVGIPIGAVGIGLVCLAYPLYNYTLHREREKIAPVILRLTDELTE